MGSPEDCTLATCPVPEGFFSSSPSLAGSAVFLVAFCFLIPINLFTGIRYKTALYSSAIIAGLAFEAMGHVGRILLRSDSASTLYFVLYTIGVNMGPTFIAAAIFLVLPHILVLYGKEFTLISQPIRFAVFFLAFGAFALAFQAVGAAFTATGGSREEIVQGTNVLITGLAMQICSIALFYTVYWYFVFRLHHRQNILDPKYSQLYSSAKFGVFLLFIQLAAAFLLIRTGVRVAALTGGLGGALSQSEIVSSLFDGALVLFACSILSILPAGAVFGDTWEETCPFTSTADDQTLPLRRPRDQQGRAHQRDISPPFPAMVPNTYQPRRPPYRPAGPPPRPPQYVASPGSPPRLAPSLGRAPGTPVRNGRPSLVKADNLW